MDSKPTSSRTDNPSGTKATPWFQAMVDHLEHMVVVLDQEGRVLFANKSATDFLGEAFNAIVHQFIWEVPFISNHADLKATVKSAVQAAAAGQTSTKKVEVFAKAGQRIFAEIRLKPVTHSDDRIEYLLAEVKDITEQKLIEESLRARERLLNTVIASAPVMLFVVDKNGIIRLSIGNSIQAVQDLEPEPLGKSVFELYSEYPSVVRNFQRALDGEIFQDDLKIGGASLHAHFSPMRNEQDEVIAVAGIVTDISENKLEQEKRFAAQAHYESIFRAAGVGILLRDLEGELVGNNQAFERMLAYSEGLQSGSTFADLIHADDLDIVTAQDQQLVSNSIDMYTSNLRYLRKDGSVVWGRTTATLINLPDDSTRIVAFVEDITQQKESDFENLEVQRNLIEVREAERLRMSQLIHDGPLQEIIGVNFNLQVLAGQENTSSHRNEIEGAVASLKKVNNQLRSICADLRPPAIGPFGLEKAIRSHAETFQANHPNLNLQLDLSPDGQTLSESIRLTFFRIYQETLNNIAQHSQAENAVVRFRLEDKQATLEVHDDGIGFTIPDRWISFARLGHLGIVGCINRAEIAGGKMEIQSQPGEGTTIRVIIPTQHIV